MEVKQECFYRNFSERRGDQREYMKMRKTVLNEG